MADDYFTPRHEYSSMRHGSMEWQRQVPTTPTVNDTFMPLGSSSDYDEPEDLFEAGPPTRAMTWQIRQQISWGVDEYDPPPKRNIEASASIKDHQSLQERLVYDDSFLSHFTKGNATISFPGANGILSFFHDIKPDVVQAMSPLLAASFEPCSGGLELHLEKLDSSTALPFLRYLYTGSYVVASVAGGDLQDVPTSVLLHTQLYELGDLYDILDLRSQAYVNVLRQCEFACSSPEAPIELCAAIQYIYRNLRGHKNLIDTIVNYCVTNFLRHRLPGDEDFQKLPIEFHQLLCETCMNLDVGDDIACAIIQLPCQTKTPRVVRGDSRDMDVVYRSHGSMDDDLPKKRKRFQPQERISNLSLALRPRNSVADESGSDEDGFFLINKKRASYDLHAAISTTEEGPSSEGEFEVITLSSGTQASDPESQLNANGFVKVEHAGAGCLPTRTKPSSANVVREDASESSDSEWSYV